VYPNLSYLFNDLFGTPADNFLSIFQTFGLFLVLAFIASAKIFKMELVRKRKQGLFEPDEKTIESGKGASITEIISNSIFGFFIGLKVPLIFADPSSFSKDAAGNILSFKGSWIGAFLGFAIFLGYTIYLSEKDKKGGIRTEIKNMYPEHYLMPITLMAAFFGILGSKLFSVLENWEHFLQAPIKTFISGSGLTIYGGLIVAFAGVYGYIKYLKIKSIHVMDAVAPALIIGYIVGRMGCHFAGDGDWGIVNTLPKPSWFIFPDWAWSYDYPHNVVNDIRASTVIENCGGVTAVSGADPLYCTKLASPVFPTPLYEIFFGLMIFIILWILRKQFRIAGLLFFSYVLLNGVERFFIEQIRVNEKYDLLHLGWSLSQWVASLLIIIGIAGLIFQYKRDEKLPVTKILEITTKKISTGRS
jgi:prolipoprotein diacylglyceryl transferase